MINIIKYQNKEKLLSPFGLCKDWWFWKARINFDKIKTVNFLLEEEKKLLKKYKSSSDGGVGLADSTTARHSKYNVFDIKTTSINKIKQSIKNNIKQLLEKATFEYKEVYIKSWFNVLKKGQSIKPHQHDTFETAEMSFLSGNLFICGLETSTFYQTPFTQQVIKIKNKPGDLIIFPSYIKHWTNKACDTRISIAFDINPSKKFCHADFIKDNVIKKIKL
tara:strand:- start:837 stop:1496 length:660 start_codon:yes stop_codon:yes gene_type:complete